MFSLNDSVMLSGMYLFMSKWNVPLCLTFFISSVATIESVGADFSSLSALVSGAEAAATSASPWSLSASAA